MPAGRESVDTSRSAETSIGVGSAKTLVGREREEERGRDRGKSFENLTVVEEATSEGRENEKSSGVGVWEG